jgi:drug/metabolite transporter (DMT)-like permease
LPGNAEPYLLLTLAQLFWAGNFVLGRALHDTIPPIALSFWRWAVALVIVLPFALPRLPGQMGELRRHWLILSLLGVLGVTNFNTFVYLGLQTTTATNAVLLVSTTPVLIVLLSFLMLGQRVRTLQVLGIFLSLAGVIVIVARGDSAVLARLEINTGDGWVMAAVASWAIYSVCLRWRPARIDPLVLLSATMVAGLLPLLPLYLWELPRTGGFDLDRVTIAAVVYVALFPSILAYVFWNQGVAALGPNRTGQLLHLMPVFGTLLSMLFLGERMAIFHLAGVGLIASGLALASSGPGHGE